MDALNHTLNDNLSDEKNMGHFTLTLGMHMKMNFMKKSVPIAEILFLFSARSTVVVKSGLITN